MSGHNHGTAAMQQRGRLAVVLSITATVMIAEVVGAWLSGSLTLLADAGHMLSDSTGLALALGATWLAARPASKRRTYGLQRAEVLAALANGVILTVVGVSVIVEAIQRWMHPGEVKAPLMLAVAAVGLVANAAGLVLLHRGQGESLNVRGAYLEVMGDLLGSVAAVAAGVVIMTTGYARADALASLGIGLFIIPRALGLLREVVHVLLEGTPRDMDLEQVRGHLVGLPGVMRVHDLHAWTITSGVPALTAHIVLEGDQFTPDGYHRTLDSLTECLADHFDVEHSTFQIEPPGHEDSEHAAHA